jgi:uncharacterized membrane protein
VDIRDGVALAIAEPEMSFMEEWLISASKSAIVAIDAIAFVVIVFGTLEAVISMARLIFISNEGQERRELWLRYARWLVAGLTFQLAADIIETSITTGWEAVARLGIIALIRTFLNFFLERDLEDVRQRQTPADRSAQLESNL